MTLNEALILSYVKRGIGYGYKILNHVRKSRSDEWVDFSRAGLYKTLDKLEKQEYVTKTHEQSGGRPPKKVYSITGEGEDALARFIEEGFNFDYQSKNDLDAYLVTAVAASPDAAFLADKVRRRSEAVHRRIASLREEWPADKDAYPLIVYVLYKRRLDILEQELEWLEWVAGVLDSISGDVLHMTWGER